MRIVIFTANPDLEATAWWTVVTQAPGVSAVLIVRRISSNSSRDMLRRLRRNVRRHGWLSAAYRAIVPIGSLLARFARSRPAPITVTPPTITVEEIRSLDLREPNLLERVRAWNPDLGISIGGPILTRALFEIPRCGTLNVRLGKVPEFRGAPPGFWELWFGAADIGAAVHRVDSGLDTGPIIECATAPIYENDTPARVEARAAELGRGLLASSIVRVAAGEPGGLPRPAGDAINRMPTVGERFVLWRRQFARRVRTRLAAPLSLGKLGTAFVWLAVWRPLRDLVRTLLGRHPVRVFTFHRVTDLCRDGMTVPASTFRRQLEYVRRHHTVVDLDRALELLAPGQRIRHPIAAITFDDGYRSVARVAQPLMEELGLTGTCFVCTGLVGTDRRFSHDSSSTVRANLDLMDWGELQSLQRAGWKIGAHTVSHARLSDVTGADLWREVSEPHTCLRQRLGERQTAMAYPFGGKADVTADGAVAAKEAGYSALFSDFGGENFPGDDPFTLKRIGLGGDHDTLMWKAAASGLDLTPWMRRLRREEHPQSSPPGAAGSNGTHAHHDTPLRVAHIVFDLDGGGIESLVASMAERWHQSSVSMSVISLSGRVGRVGEKVRPLVEQFHVLRPPRGISMLAPADLLRALHAAHPGVVHVHSGAWLKGAYAAKLASVQRVVYTEHGREHHDSLLARVQDHVASRLTQRVVAVSERLAAYMTRAVGVRGDRVVTIQNGVDTEVFAPGPANALLKRSFGVPENALVLGSVGRLEPVKAYVRLVQAYAELRQFDFGRPLVLVIFGEGSDRPEIEREVDRLGVRDGVRLPGWTEQPRDAYRLFDVFAMTSMSEGMSVSLMEAMACGTCPVATNVGSNAEVLGPALQEHVVPDGDAERLVSVIRGFLASPSKRETAGGLARSCAVERHSLSRMIREYERLYRGESAEESEAYVPSSVTLGNAEEKGLVFTTEHADLMD